MDEGYIRLYLAIFKEAAKKGYGKSERHDIHGVKKHRCKSEIRRFIDENSSRIEQDVQEAV